MGERYKSFKWAMEHAQELFVLVEAEPTEDMTPQEVANLLKKMKTREVQDGARKQHVYECFLRPNADAHSADIGG